MGFLDNEEQTKIVDELTNESNAIDRRTRATFAGILLLVAACILWRTLVLVADVSEYAGATALLEAKPSYALTLATHILSLAALTASAAIARGTIGAPLLSQICATWRTTLAGCR